MYARRKLIMIQELLSTYSRTPDYWARDCEQYRLALLGSTTRAHYALPWDLLQDRNESEVQEVVQHLLKRFGELLLAWHDVREATQYLRNKGVTLARKI